MLVGISRQWLGLWLAAAATAVVLAAYVWQMRPLYSDILTLDPRWTRRLALVKLVPPVPSDSAAIGIPAAHQS
jgi:hypothetical protein